jgi:hypothetical protein
MDSTRLLTLADLHFRELLVEAVHERLLTLTSPAALSVSFSHLPEVAPVRQLRRLARYARVLLSSLATVSFSVSRQS